MATALEPEEGPQRDSIWYKNFYTKQTPAQKLCMDQIEDYERS